MDTVSKNSTSFNSLLDSCDLTQHVAFPPNVLGHTLDLLISPSDFKDLHSVSCSVCVSDHFCITCLFDLGSPSVVLEEDISVRRYNKINMANFTNDLIKTNLICSPASDIDELFDQYNNCLTSVLDNHGPKICKRLNKPVSPWITDTYAMLKV